MNNTWQRIRRFCLVFLFAWGALQAARAQEEGDELQDTPYVSGMPNYRIDNGEDQEFGDYMEYARK